MDGTIRQVGKPTINFLGQEVIIYESRHYNIARAREEERSCAGVDIELVEPLKNKEAAINVTRLNGIKFLALTPELKELQESGVHVNTTFHVS
jgi:hypothetical protein